MILKTRKKFALLLVSIGLIASACDAPVGLRSSQTNQGVEIRANFTQSDAGLQLFLNDISTLPTALSNSKEIKAIWDNSTNIYPVQRSANGSLILNVPAGRVSNSQGEITFFLVDDNFKSYFITAQTGPALQLSSPPISFSPSTDPVVGSRVQLKANFKDLTSTKDYDFFWFYGSSRQGPWQSISGQGTEISWETPRAGDYYFKLDTQEKTSLFKTEYITSTAILSVLDTTGLVSTTPSNGSIVLGQTIQLKAQVSNADEKTQWLYGFSPAGPFQPIENQGASISWEPPAIGEYYLQIQNTNEKGELSRFTTTKPVVKAQEVDGVIVASQPQVVRGESVELKAIPPQDTELSNLTYQWAFSASPQGPFSPITGQNKDIAWFPEQTGSFFFRLRLIDSQTNSEREFISSKSLVSVTDSDQAFTVSKSNLLKGERVQLNFTQDTQEKIRWFYASSPQGPFLSISGEGKSIEWQPPQIGQFYLRAEVPVEGRNAPSKFTSANSLVSVTESNSVISINPRQTNLGKTITLKANLPQVESDQTYSWFTGPSAVGPWTPAQSFQAEINTDTLSWIPGQKGNYYVKVDAFSKKANSLLSFVTPSALVQVSEPTSFFKSNPSPANIGTQGAVTLDAFFLTSGTQFYYSWSASPSPQGPFISLGGSFQPTIEWKQPGLAGQYYIQFNVVDTTTQRHVSFMTSDPLVFVTESQTSTPRF